MTTYFIAESAPHAHILDSNWTETKAKTLPAAKRAAQAARAFQGTCAHVAVRNTNGEYIRVAVRFPKGHAQEGWTDF
jgi:hypothetical protein